MPARWRGWLLTPGSVVPMHRRERRGVRLWSAPMLMLYGMPARPADRRRMSAGSLQIALCWRWSWTAINSAFLLRVARRELSPIVIEPLSAGLLPGVALARPLLRWRYRKA